MAIPEAGLALSYSDPAGKTSSLVLAGLDGQTLANLPAAEVRDEGTSGPLLLLADGGNLLVNPDSRRVERSPAAKGELRIPLAYGAEISRQGDNDFAFTVRRGGKTLVTRGDAASAPQFVQVANDRDVVTIVPNAPGNAVEALDLKDESRTKIPGECELGDRHCARWVLTCSTDTGKGASTVEVLQTGRRTKLITGPPPGQTAGRWAEAMFSNDGQTLLLQWSGECEVQSTYLAPAAGGTPKPFTAGGKPGLEALALGWSPDNRAVVVVPTTPGCGDDNAVDGVHLVNADGTSTRVVVPPKGVELSLAHLWIKLPR
jgi:hypothetical protein